MLIINKKLIIFLILNINRNKFYHISLSSNFFYQIGYFFIHLHFAKPNPHFPSLHLFTPPPPPGHQLVPSPHIFFCFYLTSQQKTPSHFIYPHHILLFNCIRNLHFLSKFLCCERSVLPYFFFRILRVQFYFFELLKVYRFT